MFFKKDDLSFAKNNYPMYLLNLQNSLSLLLSSLFFIATTCSSGGQAKVVPPSITEKEVTENQLPTRRTLRRAFRKKHNFTIVHPNNEGASEFYQIRVNAMNQREDFIPEVNTLVDHSMHLLSHFTASLQSLGVEELLRWFDLSSLLSVVIAQ